MSRDRHEPPEGLVVGSDASDNVMERTDTFPGSRVHGILLSASIADEGKVIKCGKNLQRQTCSSDCHLQPIGMFC